MTTMYSIADQIIDFQFIFPETANYFTRFEILPEMAEGREPMTVRTTLARMDQVAARLGASPAHTPHGEYETLASATSTALLARGSFLFHSVGFTYQGKAIVYTGPSGIGKTTQYAQWKRLFRDQVKVISGDMPAIAFRENGEIWVMPSAWNGKERLHSDQAAPLGGVVVLEQAPTNTITRLEPRDAILPIYSQMCLERREKEQLTLAFQAEDALLRRIPVWKLSSRGDLDSARLCHDTIRGEIYGE